jgi:CheR methyltransferase, SAM binding domain/CheR methyltransferase, all-alpha domain
VTTIDSDFEALLVHLKDSRGFDFTGYKRSSLMRRVDRRMVQLGINDYGEYLDHLQVGSEEFTELFDTILINVTGFFRDADAWDYLSTEVLPPLLKAKSSGEPIRIWSAGCASGEEAYSLAILFTEALGTEQFRVGVKIYATKTLGGDGGLHELHIDAVNRRGRTINVRVLCTPLRKTRTGATGAVLVVEQEQDGYQLPVAEPENAAAS